jgi:hypothetical protein
MPSGGRSRIRTGVPSFAGKYLTTRTCGHALVFSPEIIPSQFAEICNQVAEHSVDGASIIEGTAAQLPDFLFQLFSILGAHSAPGRCCCAAMPKHALAGVHTSRGVSALCEASWIRTSGLLLRRQPLYPLSYSLVPAEGFEPPAPASGGRCSIP